MKRILLIFVLLTGTLVSTAQQKNTKSISGKVIFLDAPVVNAEITSKTNKTTVKTDADGRYAMETMVGDIITFSYPGLRTVEIVVEDVSRILNIDMNTEVNQLDEVVVEKTVIKSQQQMAVEYKTNKNLINTAFGILDKETTSFAVRIIDGKELSLATIDFISAIQFKFPGIRVDRDPESASGVTVYLRGAGLGFFPAIFDVDGLVVTDAPTYIQVENIERIAILPGLGLVTKYGGKANGGVIVINTKGANYFPEPGTDPYDTAKLRGNIYDGKALANPSLANSSYLKALEASTSLEDAKVIFKNQQQVYNNSFYHTLDAYTYFEDKWNASAFADELLQERWYLFEDNPVALKSLAYIYQGMGSNEKAHEMFREVFMQRPNYGQSYIDMATSYRALGNNAKAASLFARYDYLAKEGFLKNDDSDFKKLLNREYTNLVALDGKDVISDSRLLQNMKEEEFLGTRLVFEWADSEAEFDLQFVNPDNHFFTWKHTMVDDPERIKQEKLNGFSCEEYLIDDSLPGIWKINATYKGNKTTTPTYLKATIYYNYGTKAQRSDIKVFKLALRNANQHLFSISNGTVEAAR